MAISGKQLLKKGGDREIDLFMEFSYGLNGVVHKQEFLPCDDIWFSLGAYSAPVVEATTLDLEACFLDGMGAAVRRFSLPKASYKRSTTEGF